EPTSALDPELTGEILKVIRKLAEKKMTMVIVTHEMSFAREVADRIVFMAEGQVLEDRRDVDGFFDAPRDERAKQFLSKVSNH
ncbi:MAG: amino acid ABC transporter ATP-binding protein, partial [Enterococcus casseliflavus]